MCGMFHPLRWLLHPLCMLQRHYVGFLSPVWDVAASMCAAHALCGMLHPLCGMLQPPCKLLNPLCGLMQTLCGLSQTSCGLLQAICGLNTGCSEFLRKKETKTEKKTKIPISAAV